MFTLNYCNSGLSNRVFNVSHSSHQLSISAVKTYARVCYPVYDESLAISLPKSNSSGYQSSLMNANDTIFRTAMIPEGTLASASFGVNIFNHNDTHSTMGIKKSVHITLHSYDKIAVLPTSCSSTGKANITNNFIDLPYNAILCDIMKIMNGSTTISASMNQHVRMASMRVRWEDGDYPDFALNKALVINAIETPTWWIITVILLLIAFLVPQASRLIVRRIPGYSKDLRTLLLLTLRYSPEFRGAGKAKTVGIFVNELDNKADRVALLTANGFSVAVGEKADRCEARLIDEGVAHPMSKLDRYD